MHLGKSKPSQNVNIKTQISRSICCKQVIDADSFWNCQTQQLYTIFHKIACKRKFVHFWLRVYQFKCHPCLRASSAFRTCVLFFLRALPVFIFFMSLSCLHFLRALRAFIFYAPYVPPSFSVPWFFMCFPYLHFFKSFQFLTYFMCLHFFKKYGTTHNQWQ